MDNSIQSKLFMNNIIILFMFLPYILNYIPELKSMNNLFINKKKTIIIKSHEVPIVRFMSSISQSKVIYSESFLSIIYYINNKKRYSLKSLTEIITNNNELSFNERHEDDKKDFLFIPINNKNIKIDENIYCDIDAVINKNSNSDEKNGQQKERMEYVITLSTSLNIYILEKFIEECITEYRDVLKKSMIYVGQQYIYEYKNIEKSEYAQRNKIIYSECLMKHNKNLETNIFIENKEKLIQYITPFIYNEKETINKGEDKYNRCGFTFKAGLFFYGSPGCGKTSTIKAILKYTNRNGIIINLNKVKTCDELKDIFQNRIYNGRHHSGKQLCFILEDCDANENNILLSRKNIIDPLKNNNNNQINEGIIELKNIMLATSKRSESNSNSNFSSIDDDKLNLSCFLNILDGIIELYGVMIIMTTNYPELIDSALIRPGRFDFNYDFKKASGKIIQEMIQFNYELSNEEMMKYSDMDNIKDEVLSPAQVQSICFKNENVDDCIRELLKLY